MVRPLVTTLVVLLVAAAGVMAVAASRRAKTERSAGQPAAAVPAPAAATADQLQPLPAVARSADAPGTAAPAARRAAPALPKSFPVLRVRPGHTVALRAKPRGRVLTSMGATTQFGSPTTLAVAAQHGGW